jgi:hypothetical protein
MILTASMTVRRWSSRTEFGGIQKLLKEWRLFGIKVWTAVLDEETVPAWAEIEIGALGSTEWRSKFAEFISGSKP